MDCRFYIIWPVALTSILLSCSGGESDTSNEKYGEGKKLYNQQCAVCHQDNGKGIEGTYPPLANSDYMKADRKRAIEQVVNGSSGKMVVNGVAYDAIMPPQALSTQQAKDVLNYIFNSWGNSADEFTEEEVNSVIAE